MPAIHHLLFAAVAGFMREAGETITEPYAKGAKEQMQITLKPDQTIVTLADGESEAFLTTRLMALLPSSQVLGEETVQGDWRTSPLLQITDPLWIIDPIDGTIPFSQGKPYGIMVCLRRGGKIEAAWIYFPRTQEMLFASNNDSTVLMTWQDGNWSEPQTVNMPQPYIADMQMSGYIPKQAGSLKLAETIPLLFSSSRRCTCIATDILEMVMTGNPAIFFAGYVTAWDHYPTRMMIERAGGSVIFARAPEHYPASPSIVIMAPTAPITQAMLKTLQSITPIEVLDV